MARGVQAEGRVWVFGGENEGGKLLDDFFTLSHDGSSWTWTRVLCRSSSSCISGTV